MKSMHDVLITLVMAIIVLLTGWMLALLVLVLVRAVLVMA